MRRKTEKVEVQKKQCIHCGAILRKGFTTYERGVCDKCTKTLPEYSEHRKQERSKIYKRWYERNQEKERERARINDKKKRERERLEKLVNQ